MNKYQLLFILIFLTLFHVSAQEKQGVWVGDGERITGNYLYGFKEVKNIPGDGYLMIGSIEKNDPVRQSDLYLLRVNDDFEVLWSKLLGAELNEYGESIERMEDGSFMVVGTVEDVKGNRKIFLAKLDASGEFEWSKKIGDEVKDISAVSIKKTSDMGSVILGNNMTLEGRNEIYVVKVDENGNIEWDKIISGEVDVAGNGINPTPDGGYIIGGYRAAPVIVNGKNTYIVKLDASGNLEWDRAYQDNDITWASEVMSISDGGYMVVGSKITQFYFAKLNEQGEMENMVYYHTTNYISGFKKMLRKENGNIVAFGYEASYIYVTEIEENLTHVKTVQYHGQDFYYGHGFDFTDEDGLIFVGDKRKRIGSNGQSGTFAYILKTDENLLSCETSLVYVYYNDGAVLESYFSEMNLTEGGAYTEVISLNESEGPGILNDCLPLGIEDHLKPEFKLYPNPTRDKIYIDSDVVMTKITVHNMLGQRVLTSEVLTNSTSLALREFPAGIYYVNIETEKGNFMQRVIVSDK